MPTKDKRIDAYIANAPDYAKPILKQVRAWVHEGAPDCEETLKWSTPTFVQGGILVGLAAFKNHCTVHFWNHTLFMDDARQQGEGKGNIGKITSVDDLPPKKEFIGWVKKAVDAAATGASPIKRRPNKKRAALEMPGEFMAAIKKNKKALATYEAFSPSKQRDYIEWITEAKTDATRTKRMAQAVEWMAEGKPRMWKYMK